MGLHGSLEEVAARLQGLSESLSELQVTLIQDPPDEIALADGLSGVVDDLQGWIKGSLSELADGLEMSVVPSELATVVESVSRCREGILQVLSRFSSELASRHRLDQLTAVGRERGGEWSRWATGVKQSVDRSEVALQQALAALLACYQEIAERVGAGSVSVQTTAIGAEIRLRDEAAVNAHERSEQGRGTR